MAVKLRRIYSQIKTPAQAKERKRRPFRRKKKSVHSGESRNLITMGAVFFLPYLPFAACFYGKKNAPFLRRFRLSPEWGNLLSGDSSFRRNGGIFYWEIPVFSGMGKRRAAKSRRRRGRRAICPNAKTGVICWRAVLPAAEFRV